MNDKERDNRRLPTGKGVMEDKRFNDIVYAYLQSISYGFDRSKLRYIYDNQLNYTRIAKELKMNLKTLKSKIKYLFDNGYLVEGMEGKYKVYYLPDLNKYYFLIPVDTLKYLIDISNENVIMVYSYLGQLKQAMKDKSYFTKNKLLMLLGYKIKARVNGEVIERASTHQRDWERINNILDLLENKLGLIETRCEKEYIGENTVSKYYFNINTKVKAV